MVRGSGVVPGPGADGGFPRKRRSAGAAPTRHQYRIAIAEKVAPTPAAAIR